MPVPRNLRSFSGQMDWSDTMDVTECKVALLCGGWSDEREVSLTSGRECAKALAEAGFSSVDVFDIAAPDFVTSIASGN